MFLHKRKKCVCLYHCKFMTSYQVTYSHMHKRCIIYDGFYPNIYATRCNVTQFILSGNYMFQMVPSPIIRSANNCIYSIWCLSHRYCYWFQCAVHTQTSSNSSTIATGSSNSVTDTRCCRYSCLCS